MRLLGALLLAGTLSAQGVAWVQAHYTKREVMVPMRDGVHLYTAIYTPREAGAPLPFLLNRTCYGSRPYGARAFPEELGPADALARSGFVFVYQDVRGRMMSEGRFVEVTPLLDGKGVDEATDAYDTIAWLLENVPGNNGKAGLWGISYPGYYAACALAGPHPALVAVSPQAPMVDLFDGDDDHHNGAFFLSQAFWFYAAFGRPRPAPTATIDWDPGFRPAHADGYRFFLELGALPHADERYLHGAVRSWRDTMDHGTKDAYWQARDLRPHIHAPAPAVLTVGGWFDQEDLFGPLHLDRVLGPGTRTLVMGPWNHGGWERSEGRRIGSVDFGSDTSTWFQDHVEAPFFLHHLKGAPDPGLARAVVFETGANRWHALAAWPPPEARPVPLYLREGGALAFAPPPAPGGADPFTSDPAHPVPYTKGLEMWVNPAFMVGDQRFAAERPDVLTYRTGPLDRDLTLAGPVQVRLQVSTTGTDADWVVKVIDVYPDAFGEGPEPAEGDWWEPPVNPLGGFQQLVRGDVMRGKFRTGFATPAPFEPGRPTPVDFTLNDVYHTFAKGHRLMVQVQSTWFPLVDRNPQVFEDIYKAKDDDFQAAEHKVYRSPDLPSRLILPVLD